MWSEPRGAACTWVRDVKWATDVERGVALTTTGDHVWEAARHLVDYCESEAGPMGLLAHGATVLELGAGCGYLGMTVARNVPTLGRCVLTEMEHGGALDHLRHNVSLNEGLPGSRVEVAALDWREFGESESDSALELASAEPHDERAAASGAAAVEAAAPTPDEIASTRWDVVLGSDLVYDDAGVKMLPAVLARLVARGSAVFYCHTKHRFDMADADFLAELAKRGLAAEEVRRRGEDTPPPSPPPFESLFNEHRLVVWRIRKRELERAGATDRDQLIT